MNTLQLSSAILKELSFFADNETILQKVLKYVKSLKKEKKKDDTLMSKEEFFAMLDESSKEAEEGKAIKMLPNEDLDTYLKRLGYAV
ncbi:MAG: hypothetical protein IKQ70_04225 [Bacteroidales bacterium]|nr:hypothetical protein [Bacteroidales bacterium]MBR6177075.1 hypothetical protein [Bacteroidales bacterium]